MASLAETCSHVGALLHWVENTVRMHKEVSCTSQTNKWIVPNPVKQIPYCQLKDIDFKSVTHLDSLQLQQSTPCTMSDNVKSPRIEEIEEFFWRNR
jgi:hypothetical protein